MLFNSLHFLIFFPIVVLFYLIIPKKIKYLWLLIASYYFYMSWNPMYAILMGTSTIITYLSGLLLGLKLRGSDRKKLIYKKTIVTFSFLSNLGILFFFKYYDFLLNTINEALQRFNIETLTNQFDVLLPVGISFYTFQALSYTLDVYRGDTIAEKNPLRYALFVSFFPQLVAGPIERSKNLLGQLRILTEVKSFDFIRIRNGLILMIWGLFQKMVIADRLAILVDVVFDQYYLHSTFALTVAAIAFAFQIYCDFASYSMIAIGASKVIGIELMENFNTPYFSRNIREFWKRWHISLSSWFRDYLYIPLGGSHCSKVKKYRNVMLIFLLSGLWHGASWNFVIWGVMHGLYQVISEIVEPLKNWYRIKFQVKTESFSFKLGQMLITFVLVDLTWIFFRLQKVEDGIQYIKRMFSKFDPWSLFDGHLYTLGLDRFEFNILFVSLLCLFAVSLIRYKKNQNIDQFLEEQTIWFRWAVIIILLIAIPVYGVYGMNFDSSQFIYFQF